MTVTAQTLNSPFAGPYSPNGGTTAFPFLFKATAPAGVKVVSVTLGIETTVNPALYTVTLAGTPAGSGEGGTVTFGSPPAAGPQLYIYPDPSFGQEVNFVEGGPIRARTLNAAFDLAALRSLSLKTVLLSSAMVSPAARANNILGWDPVGNPIALRPVDFQGDPGGNAMAIGLFTAASGLSIPVGTDLVRTNGYSTIGHGSADYIYDAAVDAAYVTANPRVSFRTVNGRGYRLSPTQVFWSKMFGFVADDSGIVGGAAGTDSLAAYNAAKAYLATVGTVGPAAWQVSLRLLNIEVGFFYSSAEWDVDAGQAMIIGSGTGRGGSPMSQIRFPVNKGGIRTQRSDTSGVSGATGTGKDSQGSQVRNLKLLGGYAGTEGEYHGVQVRSNSVEIDDVWVENFQGDAFYIAADTNAAGGVPKGNANLWSLTRCYATACRKGLYLVGGDSNAGSTTACNFSGNRLRGLDDQCFINSVHYAPHAANNGYDPRCGSQLFGQVLRCHFRSGNMGLNPCAHRCGHRQPGLEIPGDRDLRGFRRVVERGNLPSWWRLFRGGRQHHPGCRLRRGRRPVQSARSEHRLARR